MLELPLIANSMNEKQWQYIESPELCSSLKATGVHSDTQMDIVAGLLSSLVLNNGTLYGTQGLKHIMALKNFGKTDSITGKDLRASLESTKPEVGFSGPLFTNKYQYPRNCCADRWVLNTWKTCGTINCSLRKN